MRFHRIFFVMSPGTTLYDWQRMGILERELEIAQHYRSCCKEIVLVTTGTEDANLNQSLKIFDHVITAKTYLDLLTNEYVTRFSEDRHFHQLIRTNQVSAWHYALILKVKLGAKLLLRLGYEPTRNSLEKRLRVIKFIRSWLFHVIGYLVADLVLAPSESIIEFIKRFFFVDENRIKYGGVWIASYFFEKNHRKPKKHSKRIVYVGRLHKDKNVDLVIQAIFSDTKFNCELFVYGEGPEKAGLERLASRYGVRNRVHFKGSISNIELVSTLNEYDIGILCSSYEGVPKTILEMVSRNLVVVACKNYSTLSLPRVVSNRLILVDKDIETIKAGIAEAICQVNESRSDLVVDKDFIENYSSKFVFERELYAIEARKICTN